MLLIPKPVTQGCNTVVTHNVRVRDHSGEENYSKISGLKTYNGSGFSCLCEPCQGGALTN